MELPNIETFTAIADKYGDSIRTTEDAETFFKEFMDITHGAVIVDFLDCDNDDRIEKVDFDHTKGLMTLYTRLPGKDSEARQLRKTVLPFDCYSILLRFKNVRFIRIKDNYCLAIVVNGYTMHRKMIESHMKAYGMKILRFEKKNSFFTTDVILEHNNEYEYSRAMTTPITSFWIIPKGLMLNTQDSETFLYLYNTETLSSRLKRIMGNLDSFLKSTDDLDEQEYFIKMYGNQMRCLAEGLFKLITCFYYEKMSIKNGDKEYNNQLLGHIIGPLKKQVYTSQCDHNELSKIERIANELSHDTGLPVNFNDMEELYKLLEKYISDFIEKIENKDNISLPKISDKPSPDDYVKSNLMNWNFSKEIAAIDNKNISNCSFRLKINPPFRTYSLLNTGDNYLCKDGYVKALNFNDLSEALNINNRDDMVQLEKTIYNTVKDMCDAQGLYTECCLVDMSAEIIKVGTPSHLFILDEIKTLMQNANDSLNNKLVIDENGYANIIQERSLWNLYPVSIETWYAGNGYVGKESTLSDAEQSYHLCLKLWLDYLRTGKRQYDDLYVNIEEKEIISQIMEYYKSCPNNH